MDLEFNFSRYVLNEMKNNLQEKRKDKFLMYPRFLQMIFDNQYPDIERKGQSLDLKSLGANTFCLMKQNRKGDDEIVQEDIVLYMLMMRRMMMELKWFMVMIYQMADVIANLDSTTRIPPRADATLAITPSKSDIHETQSSYPPLKRRRVDLRAQHCSLIFFKVESSSAPGGSSTPQPVHDVASERLSRFLAQQDFDPAPPDEGMSIGAGSSGGVDPLIFELQAKIIILNQKIIEKDVFIGILDVRFSDFENENLEKSQRISALQLNLGALSAGYLDMKNKVISKFGKKFK
ncbi:unnamed protein product [Lactuca saligna]|uniref:Uncharacterized protein n=1 Tax=Lactuca saligna TaxID=75948 RepID=A0AA35Z1Q5_LACSI|nr:unnamed protein product [Lactuca saligna]